MSSGENSSPATDVRIKEKSADAIGRFCKHPEIFLFLLLAMFALSIAWNDASSNAAWDFYQFWVVGQSANRPDLINVYSNEARDRLGAEFLEKAKLKAEPGQLTVAGYRRNLQTYSSPFLYALFGRFSTGDYAVDLRNYRLLLLVGLIFGIGVLCRLMNYTAAAVLGAIAIFSAWFGPFAEDLRVGNVNSLQLAALAADLWVVMRLRWKHRDILGGALMGLAVPFKPNLVPIAAMLAANWLVSRQFQRFWLYGSGAAIGAGIAILFAAASFHNFHCWTDWFSALRSLPDEIMTVEQTNYSPAELIFETSGVNVTFLLALVFGGVTIALLWSRQRNATGGELFAAALGGLLVVLAARLAWLHYYVLAIPAILFLLQPSGASRPDKSSIFPPLLAVIALMVLTASPIVFFGAPLSARSQGIFAVSAALLLFITLAAFPNRAKNTIADA